MKIFFFILLGFSFFQQGIFAKEYSEFAISFKNDALFNSDDDYTVGTELSYRSEGSDLTYYFGQDIYTPDNKKTSTPISGEHPYGAFLYIGISGQIHFTDNLVNNLKLTIGAIGEDAKGKSVSNELHKIIGATEEKGWDTQVYKEVAYNINIKSLYDPFDIGIRPYLTANVGNILTDIGLGINLHYNITNDLIFYANAQRVYVDKNIFLEGKTEDGNNAYSVIKYDYKNTYSWGLETSYFTDYIFAFEFIYNSKEYTTQANNNNYNMIKITKKF